MDYFTHNALRGLYRSQRIDQSQLSDVVELDRSADTARILRNERGEAAGFIVDTSPAASLAAARRFADAYRTRR